MENEPVESSEVQVVLPQDDNEIFFLQRQFYGETDLVQVKEEYAYDQSSVKLGGKEGILGIYTGQVFVILSDGENNDKRKKYAIPHGYGVMSYNCPIIEKYEGRFEYGQRSGYGAMTFSSKISRKRRLSSSSQRNTNIHYWGQWKKNQMHGRGLLQSCNENGNMTYQIAQWNHNKLHGPTFSFIVNPVKKTKVWCIEGEHVNGKLSYGTMKYHPVDNGSSIEYEGYIQKTKPSWFGSIQIQHQTSNIAIPRQLTNWQYRGEFCSNDSHNDEDNGFGVTTPSGYGEMCLVNDNRYIGYVQNGTFHGKGKLIYRLHRNSNNTNNIQPYYDGQWVHGKKCGYGIQIYRSDFSYEGEWFDDQYHGHGILKQTHNSKYEGDFVHGLRHGRGTQTFPNGDIYGGRWIHDQQSGYGVMKYHDRTVYEGDWISNTRQGFGKYYNENREVIQEGQWFMDRLVSST